jgi:hypothetical protein
MENVQDSMLWRWMRWQSWHRNVGRCDGQTGIMADLDREAINTQQHQRVIYHGKNREL